MKIAIDCRALEWEHSGIARYLNNILLKLLEIDKKNFYFLLSPNDIFFDNKKYQNTKRVHLKGNDFYYKYWKTPQFLLKEKIDIFWSPTQDLPLWKPYGCKFISTIHDAAIEHDISTQSFRVKTLFFLGFYKKATEMADIILTDSNFSKKDIANVYKVPKSKIVVTYLGIDSNFKKIAKKKAKKFVKNSFGIDKDYIFYINTGKPKNLFKAFASLLKTEKSLALVSLGESSKVTEKIEYLSSKLRIKNNTFSIDSHVTDEALNNLYSGSEFFISPSYYEGFGLTPLEALACGSPILISNTTAYPEVYQSAALYCDPSSIKDIRDKMIIYYRNSILKRKKLKEGKALLKLYTWENTVLSIIDVFNRLESSIKTKS